MIRKVLLSLFLTLSFVCFSLSQNEIDYKMIDSLGKNFTSRLKNGNIAYLKNSKPPKGTYTYKKLAEFKQALENYPSEIILGSFIEPSDDPSFYAYNLFAYRRIDEKSWEYYFAAIVSVDISSNLYKIENTYLFTEQRSLKSWWRHIFGFYKNETNKDIPREFVFPFCPPPPFK